MKSVIRSNKINFFVFNISLLITIIFSFFVIKYDDLLIDRVVYNFLIDNFSCNFMDKFMMFITRFGNTKFVIFFTSFIFGFMLFGFKPKKTSFVFAFSVGGVAFVNQLLKHIVRRIRPDVNRLIDIGGYSFPSGHAMVSMILYGLIAYSGYKVIKNKWFRNSVVFINCLLILLIGISRIYLGVHYFSDIVVGFLISLLILIVIINYLEKYIFSQN